MSLNAASVCLVTSSWQDVVVSPESVHVCMKPSNSNTKWKQFDCKKYNLTDIIPSSHLSIKVSGVVLKWPHTLLFSFGPPWSFSLLYKLSEVMMNYTWPHWLYFTIMFMGVTVSPQETSQFPLSQITGSYYSLDLAMMPGWGNKQEDCPPVISPGFKHGAKCPDCQHLCCCAADEHLVWQSVEPCLIKWGLAEVGIHIEY